MAGKTKAGNRPACTKQDTGKNQLTEKQMAFALEYLVDRNATKAAIRAGYSERSARRIGSDNLANPLIREKIRAAQEAAAERNEIDRDWVLTRAKDIAESPGTATKDQLRALDLICKLLGLYEQQQTDNRIEVVLGAAEDWCV